MNPSDVERILADFRRWLEAQPEGTTPAPAPAEPVDLATLVRHFTALRQEVNLQTRASRGQMEQNATALERLEKALAHLDEDDDAETDDTVRPLLKALLDARDALALARNQLTRTLRTLNAPADAPSTFWSRWFGRPVPGAAPDPVYRETLESVAAEATEPVDT